MKTKRSAIPKGDKKAVALSLGCLPGMSIPVVCDYCEATGLMIWEPRYGVRLGGGFEWDHMRPLSRGGELGLGNIWPMCKPCNRRKGAMRARDFALIVWPELARIGTDA